MGFRAKGDAPKVAARGPGRHFRDFFGDTKAFSPKRGARFRGKWGLGPPIHLENRQSNMLNQPRGSFPGVLLAIESLVAPSTG